jgi:hypothetical protein
MPLATHGVTQRPARTRPSTTSSQAPGTSAKPTACSQTQRSACSAPQLWPVIPRHPATSVRRPPASTQPLNTASGRGLSSLVRGSGARYIHSRGRCRSSGSAPAASRSHDAVRPSADAEPRKPVGGGPGSDSLTAYGAPASASQTVHHSAPVGSAPGRWCVV